MYIKRDGRIHNHLPILPPLKFIYVNLVFCTHIYNYKAHSSYFKAKIVLLIHVSTSHMSVKIFVKCKKVSLCIVITQPVKISQLIHVALYSFYSYGLRRCDYKYASIFSPYSPYSQPMCVASTSSTRTSSLPFLSNNLMVPHPFPPFHR